jgi:surface antigen
MLCAISLLAIGCAASGCSSNVRLPAMFGKEDEKPASDLAYAKVAATEVVSLDKKDASLPWENPASGARGTVTPLTGAYRIDGEECRDFLASYIAEGSEAWFQGEACREAKGKWEVRRMKAWRRS